MAGPVAREAPALAAAEVAAARAPAAGQTPATGEAKPLPRLREDLVLSRGATSWLIYDPLRHRFVEIDQATFDVLSLWRSHTTATTLAQAVTARSGRPVDATETARLAQFLEANALTAGGAGDDWRHLSHIAGKRPHGLLMSLVHNYLFFKIPIASPQSFLVATQWVVAPLFAWQVQALIAALGLVGLYLVSHEWDGFIHEARGLATLGGAASFGATLFVVKAFHELGHGYSAVRHGCRVPSMGIAFMMMAPLLYTDVTDAWRLADRRKRLAIDGAGVAVELGFACLATLLWVFMPDGLARHVVFLVATTSWVMSLAINLNPFMRFDGYYILSDLLAVPNLQPRAFALGTWQLREILFRLKAPCPENMPPRLTALLIVYAWSVWIYRLFLFIGIAALVYAYFFKMLGILLFAFEIGYFIVKPIVKELKAWWTMRKAILMSQRAAVTFAVVVALLAMFVLPWSTHVSVPAIMEAAQTSRVHPPRAALVARVLVAQGDRVRKGQPLVQLEQPDLAAERATIRAKRDAVRLRIDRQVADRDDRDDTIVLASELAALKSRLSGLDAERDELLVRAPQDGIVAELNPTLHAGRWIAAKEQVALIVEPSGAKVTGYLAEDGLWRIEPGNTGMFVPEVALAPAAQVRVASIAAGATSAIEIAALASANGGHVEVQADARQRLIPASAQYLIVLDVTGPAPSQVPSGMAVRGTVVLQGRAESAFAGFYRRALKVLVRESGA
jgi:putative peptide zinc metalloprotease protein